MSEHDPRLSSEEPVERVPEPMSTATMLRKVLLNRRMAVLAGVNAVVWGYYGVNCVRLEQRRKALEAMRAENTDRPKPERIADDPELQTFLADRFEVISGNATVEAAKVIGLGELHFRFKDTDKVAKQKGFKSMTQLALALQKLAKAGDHVLIEGIGPERGEFRPNFALHPSLAFIDRRENISVSGWDDEDLLKLPRTSDDEVRRVGKLRNEKSMFPAILERAKRQKGKVFVTSGVAHFGEDPRIDKVLGDNGIPFILLGEKSAMETMRGLD